MGFYKNIGSPFVELKIKDFEVPYPGGLPECYKHYGEICHIKYYGKDYYFKVRIPEFEKVVPNLSNTPEDHRIIDSYFRFNAFSSHMKPATNCKECIFCNPNVEKSGIHCLLRRGKSQYRCNRCVYQFFSYFEPLNFKDNK